MKYSKLYWHKVDEKPEMTDEVMGSGFTYNVIAETQNAEYELCYYFHPWRNIKLEGFKKEGTGEVVENVVRWAIFEEE